jgi:hypothetical protein
MTAIPYDAFFPVREAWFRAVLADRSLSATAKNVAIAVGIRLNRKMGGVWSMWIADLADSVGTGHRTVQSALADLERCGYLDRRFAKGPKGNARTEFSVAAAFVARWLSEREAGATAGTRGVPPAGRGAAGFTPVDKPDAPGTPDGAGVQPVAPLGCSQLHPGGVQPDSSVTTDSTTEERTTGRAGAVAGAPVEGPEEVVRQTAVRIRAAVGNLAGSSPLWCVRIVMGSVRDWQGRLGLGFGEMVEVVEETVERRRGQIGPINGPRFFDAIMEDRAAARAQGADPPATWAAE